MVEELVDISKWIKRLSRKKESDTSKAAAEVLKRNKLKVETNERFDLSTLIHKILGTYDNLPTPFETEDTIKYIKDQQPKLAQDYRETYYTIMSYLMKLKRTNLTEQEQLEYFVKIDELYNKSVDLLAKMNELEAQKKVDRPYDII